MKKIVLLVLALSFLTPVWAQKKIFVATNGNDKNSGSIEKPVFSISQAVTLSQQLKSKKVDILLRKGIYYPDATIELKAVDFKGKKIRIAAFENEEVTISGAKKVNLTWAKYNSTLFSAKVNLDFTTDAMFVNGQTAIMARYPNYDSNARFFNGTAADAISPERVQHYILNCDL